MDRLRRTRRIYGGVMLFCLVDIPIGVAVGTIDALFGRMLLASAFRDAHVFALVPFLAAGALIAWAYLRFGKNAGRGMSLVFDVGLDRKNVISLRLIPLIMGGTWITYLFGGSVSREDVTMQIGATLSHWIGQKLPFRNPVNTFLLVGMATGFAGLFGTPLAATLSALEVLVAGRLKYRALFPALTASIASSTTSKTLGLAKFEVALSVPVAFGLPTLRQLLLLGIGLASRVSSLPGACCGASASPQLSWETPSNVSPSWMPASACCFCCWARVAGAAWVPI